MEVEAIPAGGDDRVVATAHQIVKSLGTSENMTRDMLTILSTFDNRLSTISTKNPCAPPRKSGDFEANLASADRIISWWDSHSSKAMVFQRNRKGAYEYLAAVDSLRQLMENLVITPSSSAKLVRAERLMEMSMGRLQKEFHRILSTNFEPTLAPDDGNWSRGSSDDESMDEDGSSGERRQTRNFDVDEICEIDMMPLDVVLDLRSIAKRIVAGGYGSECVRIYGLTRKSVIEDCLKRIGADRISTSDVQKMEWGILDSKIKNWIRTVRIAVRILFASEKRFSDEIFAGLNDVRDSCFTDVVKGATMKLLAFGESVAMSKMSSERLFRVLDMYEALSDLMPDIDTVYCQESCASVRTQASAIFVLLGESVREILTEFENAIQEENSKTPVPGGTIHPLTRKIKGSELLGLLGHGWITNNEDNVRQYAANYEREAWMKVLNCLRDKEIHVSEGCSIEVSQQAVQDRFKDFNFAIEEVLRKHSGWMVPDVELQEKLRHSITEKMIPDYRSFLGTFGSYLESGRHSEMYMKYTPEELEAHLSDLFKVTHHP